MRLHAINETGVGSLSTMAALGDLPILQDNATAQVWTQWGAVYRDVIVLDGDNEIVAVYNLTANDLQNPANYDALRTILLDAVAP